MMLQQIVTLIFFIAFISLIFKWLRSVWKYYFTSETFKEFFEKSNFKTIILAVSIIAFPLFYFNSFYIEPTEFESVLKVSIALKIGFCFTISALISGIWIYYLYQLDIYEREKWYHLFIVFLGGSLFSFLCWILYPVAEQMGLKEDGTIINDFFYSVFTIGFIEEMVKIVPVLLLLRFSKAINEPFDYILYASCSALGFAFIENAMYLYQYDIEITHARALYAAVAHMTFSSTIAYGMLLSKFRFTNIPIQVMFVLFLLLAMFSHGFYDFWLINPIVSPLSSITFIWLLITIHLWFLMKNNAINVSNFYRDDLRIDNLKLRSYLVVVLIFISMLAYTWIAYTNSVFDANTFLTKSLVNYGYLIIYLIFTFSRYKIVKGLLAPFSFSFKVLVPTLKHKASNQ